VVAFEIAPHNPQAWTDLKRHREWIPHSTSSEILRVLRRISATIVGPRMAGEPDLRLRLKGVPSALAVLLPACVGYYSAGTKGAK
jgi:hypothetical protein